MGKWLGVVFACLVAATSVAAQEDCAFDIVYLRGDWGSARISVDVVDTPESRSRGLMFVDSLPRMSGMLFVYDHEQPVAFWMKNTLIPLDMIFANGAGVVQHVHENAVPEDLTAIPGGDDIQFVLEINGGMAGILGIGAGTEMRHPAIPVNSAAWSCAS